MDSVSHGAPSDAGSSRSLTAERTTSNRAGTGSSPVESWRHLHEVHEDYIVIVNG